MGAERRGGSGRHNKNEILFGKVRDGDGRGVEGPTPSMGIWSGMRGLGQPGGDRTRASPEILTGQVMDQAGATTTARSRPPETDMGEGAL